MELVYYQRWLSQESEDDQAAFTEQFVRQDGAADVLTDFQIPRQNWLDWRYIFDPYKEKRANRFATFC